jgi:hypothetical protein
LVVCFLHHHRGYSNGHRGIWLERGQDNLLANFNISTKMYHDISVSFYEHSTAFVNGTGKVKSESVGNQCYCCCGSCHSSCRRVHLPAVPCCMCRSLCSRVHLVWLQV